MTAIFSLEQWLEITSHGTSGDQIGDILGSWKANREDLTSTYMFWKAYAKEGEDTISKLTQKNLDLRFKVRKLRKLLFKCDSLIVKHNRLFLKDEEYKDWSSLQIEIVRLLEETGE